MTNFEFYYRLTYRRAKDETKIDWHREEPPRLVAEAVELGGGHGRSLDIGCGTGVNSVFMARHGYDVTAVDFIPESLRFGIRRAGKAGVKVDFVAGDITEYNTRDRFDLIIDVGCFHGFNDRYRTLYREKLMGWLADGGQYVLVHFSRGHALGLVGRAGEKGKKSKNSSDRS